MRDLGMSRKVDSVCVVGGGGGAVREITQIRLPQIDGNWLSNLISLAKRALSVDIFDFVMSKRDWPEKPRTGSEKWIYTCTSLSPLQGTK